MANIKPIIDKKRVSEIRKQRRQDKKALVEQIQQLSYLYGSEFVYSAFDMYKRNNTR